MSNDIESNVTENLKDCEFALQQMNLPISAAKHSFVSYTVDKLLKFFCCLVHLLFRVSKQQMDKMYSKL